MPAGGRQDILLRTRTWLKQITLLNTVKKSFSGDVLSLVYDGGIYYLPSPPLTALAGLLTVDGGYKWLLCGQPARHSYIGN